MKNNLVPIAAALLAATVLSVEAELLELQQLPPIVQQSINNSRGPAGIRSIERTDRFGAPVYAVRLDQPGPNNELLVTESGTLVDADSVISSRPGLIQSREVLFTSLPLAVQNAVRAQVGNLAIPSVDMITADGQTVYQVPSRVNRDIVDLWIDNSGRILALSPTRVLLSNPTRVVPDQLPAAVQETLRAYSEGAPITTLSRGIAQGRVVYDAVFKRNGRDVDLRIAEDGSLFRDTVNDRFLANTGRMTRLGLVANAPPRLPLAQAVTLSFNQLPLTVLSTLQSYAGADYISRIEKGIAQGQSMYEALFTHAGRDVSLRLADDGSLVRDRPNEAFLAEFGQGLILPRTTVGQAPVWQSETGTGFSR